MLDRLLEWVRDNATMLIWSTALSAALLVISVVVSGIVLVKVEEDYFTPAAQAKRKKAKRHLALAILKNIVGWALIAAGIVMLIGPGQGLIVTLIGVMVADFPGKNRLERWIVTRKGMLRTINRLRKRYHKPPLRTADPTPPGGGAAATTYTVAR